MLILFDLDGTLTDPETGITRCVQAALRHFGIDVADAHTLTPYIGPPLRESFMQLHGLNGEQATEALVRYRERFSTVGLFENRVYDGIPELLRSLCGHGARLAVATSKPTVYSERILDHFGLLPFFERVTGSELNGARTAKADVIAEALRQADVSAADAWMVGDRRFDIEGAHACGVRAVGVTYGFAAPGELQAAGAELVADSVATLGILLENAIRNV